MLGLILTLLFVGQAAATDLEDKVAAYNGMATGLQSLWDDFEDDHAAAFADYKAMWDNYYYYMVEEDHQDALAYYDDYETALASLDHTTGPAVGDSYELFAVELMTVVSLLDEVVTEDVGSSSEVAYVSGTAHFSLPSQPFPFWNDPAWDDYNEWIEFEFPKLAVGSPPSYSSWYDEDLASVYQLCQSATDPEAWINFGAWLLEHYADAYEITGLLAGDYDALCKVCTEELAISMQYRDWLKSARGYTDEEIDNFCDIHGPEGDDLCSDDNLSDRNKARAVVETTPGRLFEVIDNILEIIADYLNLHYKDELVVVQQSQT